jgi:hypothetical protein
VAAEGELSRSHPFRCKYQEKYRLLVSFEKKDGSALAVIFSPGFGSDGEKNSDTSGTVFFCPATLNVSL